MDLAMDARSVFMRTLAWRVEAGAEARAKKDAEVLSQLLEIYTASKSSAVKFILHEAVGKVERVLAQEYAAADAEALADHLAAIGASEVWQTDAGSTAMRTVVDGGAA